MVTGAHATRVLVEGKRAVGVAFLRDGVQEEAHADGEVILAGGTVNSPQLLMLSGIGPADELKSAGISAIHDMPGVGKNLQDHPMVSVGYLCTQKNQPGWRGNAWEIFCVGCCGRNGPLASNVAEAGLFLRTREGLAVPDLQLLFGPAYYRGHGLVRRKEHCFGFGPTLVTPESRGEISLRSSESAGAAGDSRELSFHRSGFAHDDRGCAAGAAAGTCKGV